MEFIDLKSQYQNLKKNIDNRIKKVLHHGQFILGPEVYELEEKLTNFTGASECITVSSGTDALLISLMACGVGYGDEVITTAFSFISTAEVIVLIGAKPVFVDINPSTCNIDTSKIEEKITGRTKAIIPVSLYGQPADMHGINKIAEKYGLMVIEDAAQSFGAIYHGKRSCNLSKIGCTSFFPSKPLGCYGDGGAIFTSDSELAQKIRLIRVHGQSKRYVHTEIGVAGRMDTLQCAIVLAKLDVFEEELCLRNQVAINYFEALKGRVELPEILEDSTSSFAQFTIFHDNREVISKYLAADGVPTAIHYPSPIPSQQAYIRFSSDENFPYSTQRSKQVLSLPMSPYLNSYDQEKVINSLIKIL